MAAAGAVLRRFVAANVGLSRATERRLDLPTDKTLWRRFETQAGEAIRDLPPGGVAVDLGGGRRCVYAGQLEPGQDARLVAVDVSREELALNTDVAETHVADVSDRLPFEDESVDLILSRALLEHVDGVPRAVSEMGRVLRPGGQTLHLIPGRYSLFGTVARVLPFKPLLAVVHAVMPWTRGQVEFDVHYDHCYPQAMERMFREAGFREVDVSVTWAQPGYFEAAYPLFLLHAGYEWLTRRLRARRLAAYMLVRAVR
jgi:SAM-dependent methyltransferase